MEKILGLQDLKDLTVKKKNINRSLTGFEVALMRHMNMSFDNFKDSTFISDALIYGDPNVKYEMSISDEDLEVISAKNSEDVGAINKYLCEQEKPMTLVSGLQIKQDNDITLNNFQKSVLSILAELTKRR